MHRFFLLALFIFTSGSMAAMGPPSVEVQVGAEDNYGWQGPGWYYGHYFDNEDDYMAWRQGQAPYYGSTSETLWIGPGWYGGYWYWNEDEWRRHYHHHYYYDHHHRDHDHRDHDRSGIQERRENRGDHGDHGGHGDRRANVKERAGGHRGGGGGGHR